MHLPTILLSACLIGLCGCKKEVSQMPSERLVGHWALAGDDCEENNSNTEVFYGSIDKPTGLGVVTIIHDGGSVQRLKWKVVNETYRGTHLNVANINEGSSDIRDTIAMSVSMDGRTFRTDSLYMNSLIQSSIELHDAANYAAVRAGRQPTEMNKGMDAWSVFNSCHIRLDDRTAPE